MTPVERAHSHGKGHVVTLLSSDKLEILGRHLTGGQAVGRDQLGRRSGQRGNGLGRTVDGQNMAMRADTLGDRARRSARPTADLDHPESRPERRASTITANRGDSPAT